MQPIIEQLVFWQCDAFVQSLVLLLGVTLVWVLIRRRVSQQWGIALFLLVFLKAIVPMTLPVPDALARFLPSSQFSHVMPPKPEPDGGTSHSSVEFGVLNVENNNSTLNTPNFSPTPLPGFTPENAMPVSQAPHETPVLEASTAIAESTQPAPAVLLPPDNAKGVATRPFSPSWGSVVLCVWLTGVSYLFGRLCLRQVRFSRQIRHARIIPATELAVDFKNLCRLLTLKNIPVYESAVVNSPAVYGLFRPVILLPAQLCQTISAMELR